MTTSLSLRITQQVKSLSYNNLGTLYLSILKSCPTFCGSVVKPSCTPLPSCTLFHKPVKEERNIRYSPELCPEGFDFCIEGFSIGICGSVDKEIEYGIIMVLKGVNHRIEVVHPQFLHLIKPPCQFQPCRVLDASGIINIGKSHGQVIGFLSSG